MGYAMLSPQSCTMGVGSNKAAVSAVDLQHSFVIFNGYLSDGTALPPLRPW
jgi:hypothetical protein